MTRSYLNHFLLIFVIYTKLVFYSVRLERDVVNDALNGILLLFNGAYAI